MRWLRALLRNRSGLAMIEFALGAPPLLMAGLWGTETANLALTTMKVNQFIILDTMLSAAAMIVTGNQIEINIHIKKNKKVLYSIM